MLSSEQRPKVACFCCKLLYHLQPPCMTHAHTMMGEQCRRACSSCLCLGTGSVPLLPFASAGPWALWSSRRSATSCWEALTRAPCRVHRVGQGPGGARAAAASRHYCPACLGQQDPHGLHVYVIHMPKHACMHACVCVRMHADAASCRPSARSA